MQDQSAQFRGRAFVIDDDVFHLEVFEFELWPSVLLNRRSGGEWADESLREMGAAWFREALGFEGNFQVLFEGQIRGWFDAFGEWDEEIVLEPRATASLDEAECEVFLGRYR